MFKQDYKIIKQQVFFDGKIWICTDGKNVVIFPVSTVSSCSSAFLFD